MSLSKQIKIAKRNTVITPRVNVYLTNHPDGIKIDSPELQQRVVELLAPSTGDRSGAFHPSQLYQCTRRQIFDYFGLNTDGQAMRVYNPFLQNLFNDGHFRHLRWQIMLLEAGILTDVEVPVSLPESRLSGSIDGVNKDDGWMFELKGTSQFSSVVKTGAMAAHVKQINAYLLASGLEKAIIVYECKSSQQWLEIEVARDAEIIREIEMILIELNHAIDEGEMPGVLHDCKNQTGPVFSSCQYNRVCLGIGTTVDIRPLVSPERWAAYTGSDA